jgi:siroheme synthase
MNYDKQEFEERLEETDTTAILLGIHAELQEIRQLLDDVEQDTEMLVCDTCQSEFTSVGTLRQHARKTHNAPPDMPLDDLTKS